MTEEPKLDGKHRNLMERSKILRKARKFVEKHQNLVGKAKILRKNLKSVKTKSEFEKNAFKKKCLKKCLKNQNLLEEKTF